eukprot:CAMPEP_0178947006 /NCGR_PEP_ID=MMETSP0789-20121207/4599_1 /TAXON_ID=3005 /ORGANISM="Rhizosolenia setigera, Strain CCMP 1694" /LENGTH=1005 /DNA_ID=CAMNT_0020627057 /DNA_START=427 /DNA_END=3444 /DNA_ORIENTATION=+
MTSNSLLLGVLTIASSNKANAASEVVKSGELFSSKREMLNGSGSDEARGISQNDKKIQIKRKRIIQNVYNTRFITYLTRFLLHYDPAAQNWWSENFILEGESVSMATTTTKTQTTQTRNEISFSQFADSVEIGLVDYFLGSYGSYASVQAAKAGLNAAIPATSSQSSQSQSSQSLQISQKKQIQQNKQGILNLLALLQARYTTPEQKVQLSILFSFISDPKLQPTDQISALLGEADNASLTKIVLPELYELEENAKQPQQLQQDSFSLLNKYGGYSSQETPIVRIDSPPALGTQYQNAKAISKMKPTSRILKIKLLDGGMGYTSVPTVTIEYPNNNNNNNNNKRAQACAIMNREGQVDSIVVIQPGFGYDSIPKITISAPTNSLTTKKKKKQKQETNNKSKPTNNSNINNNDMNAIKDNETTTTTTTTITKRKKEIKPKYKRATAIAELEYQIDSIEITNKGNGYIASELSQINVSVDPPKGDTLDWVLSSSNNENDENVQVQGKVISSQNPNFLLQDDFDVDTIVKDLQIDATALLPTCLRPTLILPEKIYTIPSLPKIESIIMSQNNIDSSSIINPRLDIIFGRIGDTPVTKRALKLSANEYLRLGGAGAICTVLVRTMLNPLELVKTKIQLENDDELFQYCQEQKQKQKEKQQQQQQQQHVDSSTTTSETNKLSLVDNKPSTTDIIQALIQTRGIKSLFQSCDVTFLSSLVLGGLGFGATELFRRSFTMVFFDTNGAVGVGGGGSSSGTNEEIVLLLAATVATIVTAFAVTPFEMIRVKSMGIVGEPKFQDVFKEFIVLPPSSSDNDDKKNKQKTKPINEIILEKIQTISPLWGGFSAVVSRELPFAVAKFLVFDLVANAIVYLANNNLVSSAASGGAGGESIQVGVGTIGLAISAFAGALAGIAGAFVSHPADLILTLKTKEKEKDWKDILKEKLEAEGGVRNLYAGFPARSLFFFLVIGLQFFLYDYVKNILEVGSDDLTLVLDVFYAVRKGLVEMDSGL